MVFVFLFIVYLPSMSQTLQELVPKFEVVMDIWFVENLIFIFSGVLIRYAN